MKLLMLDEITYGEGLKPTLNVDQITHIYKNEYNITLIGMADRNEWETESNYFVLLEALRTIKEGETLYVSSL